MNRTFAKYTLSSSLLLIITGAGAARAANQLNLSESGTHYYSGTAFWNDPGSTSAALLVRGDADVVFTGAGITLTATGTTGRGYHALGVQNGASVYLYSSTLAQTRADGYEGGTQMICVEQNSKFYGENLVIAAAGRRISGLGLRNNINGLVSLRDSAITASGSAAAIFSEGSGVMLMENVTAATTAAAAPGVQFSGGLPRFEFTGGSIRTAGAGSPALWLGAGNLNGGPGAGCTSGLVKLTAATVTAENSAAIDLNTDLPLSLRPNIASPAATWRADYTVLATSATISGAAGAVRATSVAVSGATVSQIETTLAVSLKDSVLAGDIDLFASASGRPPNSAKLLLDLDNSTLRGDLRAADGATARVRLAGGSVMTGDIVLDGAAGLDFDGILHGGVTAGGTAAAALRLADATLAGGITLGGGARLAITAPAGAAVRVAGDITLNDQAVWRLAAKTTVAGALALAPGATIAIADARGDDLAVAGPVTGAGLLDIGRINGAVLGRPEIRVVAAGAAGAGPMTAAFSLARPLNHGLAAYALENRDDGAWLTGGIGPAGAAVFNTPALAAADWFHAAGRLHRRDNTAAAFRGARASRVRTDGVPPPAKTTTRAGGAASSDLWLQLTADRAGVSAARPGLAFDQTTFALAAGSALRWDAPAAATAAATAAGLFLATARAGRDFAAAATGETTSAGAGLTLDWSHDAGWRAGLVARLDTHKHHFETAGAAADAIRADYRTATFGASAELGLRLPVRPAASGCWFEPSAAAGVVRLNGATYATQSALAENIVPVRLAAATAAQYRLQLAFGRDAAGGLWRFRARLAAANVDASGGGITAPGLSANFTRDGWCAEAGLGVARALGRGGHLYLDYEYATASGFDRPWTAVLGWRRSW
jgi:outer membrane autotransporter protein